MKILDGNMNPCLLFQHHSAPTAYDMVLKHLNTAFTVLFSLECILKIMAFGLVVRMNTTRDESKTGADHLYLSSSTDKDSRKKHKILDQSKGGSGTTHVVCDWTEVPSL